jgi:hypothetical protein
MPTDTTAKGRAIDVLTKVESAFATPPSGNWTQTLAYGPITLGESKGFEDDPILGAGLANNVDTSAPAPALPSAGGNIGIPLDLAHLGYWLAYAFGAPATSGTDPDYEHVFSSGLESIPTFAVEIKKAASLFYTTLGCAVNRLTFNAQREAGYARIVAELIACKESKGTSTGGGTPAAMLARAPVAAFLPVFKINDSIAGQVLSMNAVYDNKLVGQDFLSADSSHIAGIERDVDATFTGSITARFKTATLHDLGIAASAFKGELLWQVSAARSLSLVAEAMRIERVPVEVAGPGGIDVTFPFRAEATADDAMLVATLKSPTAVF